jgi:hypothetical protein
LQKSDYDLPAIDTLRNSRARPVMGGGLLAGFEEAKIFTIAQKDLKMG